MKAQDMVIVGIMIAVTLLACDALAIQGCRALVKDKPGISRGIMKGVACSGYGTVMDGLPILIGSQRTSHKGLLLLAAEGSGSEGATSRGDTGREEGIADRDAAGNKRQIYPHFYYYGVDGGPYGPGSGYEGSSEENAQEEASGFRIDKDKYYMNRDPYYMDRR